MEKRKKPVNLKWMIMVMVDGTTRRVMPLTMVLKSVMIKAMLTKVPKVGLR